MIDRFPSRVASWLLILGVAATTGCASGPARRAESAQGKLAAEPIQVVAVSDQDFAAQTYRLLLDGAATRERAGALVGVVRHQLRRTTLRFEQGSPSAGLRSLLGGMLLIRVGEHRREVLDGGQRALSRGAAEVARLGQEGYAVGFYSMLAGALPAGPERAEVDAHLKAIQDFARSTQGSGPVRAAGNQARVAVQRALVESTPEAVKFAEEKLYEWIRRGADFNTVEQPMTSNVDRDEMFEAYRGQRTGPTALAALYLRHGDAHAALAALEAAEIARLVSPELRDHLQRAAEERDPVAWAALCRFFQATAETSDYGFDPELMSGAAWGSAVELYRAEPSTLRGAMPLAAQLITHGMAEVASVVLTSVLTKQSSAEELGIALATLLNAIIAEDAAGQIDGARRTYTQAAKLIELAEARPIASKVSPGAARLHFVMAALETRRAELDRARPLLERALALEPSIEALTMVTSIERQKKNTDAALRAADGSLELARRAGDLLAECDALLQKFEVLRDAGRPEAGKALDEALARAIDATRAGRPGPSQARVERLLARILEQYGDRAAVRRATARAYEAAGGDSRQLAATVLDAARRALTQGDLPAARAAAQRAIDAGLASDEMVYVALWLQLLERRFATPSDGTVEEAYAAIDESSGWPARLRAWARGKISDQELVSAARDPAERTEATFYVAMSEQLSGKPEAQGRLRDVATSAAIDLMEVAIARDLLAPTKSYRLPPSVVVP